MVIAIIGGGPIGLAVLAHSLHRNLDPILFEKSDGVGGTFYETPHVNMFSPWRYSVDRTLLTFLRKTTWTAPDCDTEPTGREFVDRYCKPFADMPEVSKCIHFHSEVISVCRKGCDKTTSQRRSEVPFIVTVRQGDTVRQYEVDKVVDASGTQVHNRMGANGLMVKGEEKILNRIQYGMPDIMGKLRHKYEGKRVLVVGSGHSAMEDMMTLVDLNKGSDNTVWAIRAAHLTIPTFDDVVQTKFPALIKLIDKVDQTVQQEKCRLVTSFRVNEVRLEPNGKITVFSSSLPWGAPGPSPITGIDEIIVSTGCKPDHDIIRELRFQLDSILECPLKLGPVIDPEHFTCVSVKPHGYKELGHPEENFFMVGKKSYGRAPRHLLDTGVNR